MEIRSFEVATNKVVTLHMAGLPMDASHLYTSIDISGTPQGSPALYPSDQRIEFQAKRDTDAGPITVRVNKTSEGDLVATSAADYNPDATIPIPKQPRVNGATPTTLSPGARMTLRGSNLSKVVAVRFGMYTDITRNVQASDGSVGLSVPSTVLPGEAQIYIETSVGGGFVKTNITVTIKAF